MVTIAITAEAFFAIEATLPNGSNGDARRTARALLGHAATQRDRSARGDARPGRE
jgi:hypothetical protein